MSAAGGSVPLVMVGGERPRGRRLTTRNSELAADGEPQTLSAADVGQLSSIQSLAAMAGPGTEVATIRTRPLGGGGGSSSGSKKRSSSRSGRTKSGLTRARSRSRSRMRQRTHQAFLQHLKRSRSRPHSFGGAKRDEDDEEDGGRVAPGFLPATSGGNVESIHGAAPRRFQSLTASADALVDRYALNNRAKLGDVKLFCLGRGKVQFGSRQVNVILVRGKVFVQLSDDELLSLENFVERFLQAELLKIRNDTKADLTRSHERLIGNPRFRGAGGGGGGSKSRPPLRPGGASSSSIRKVAQRSSSKIGGSGRTSPALSSAGSSHESDSGSDVSRSSDSSRASRASRRRSKSKSSRAKRASSRSGRASSRSRRSLKQLSSGPSGKTATMRQAGGRSRSRSRRSTSKGRRSHSLSRQRGMSFEDAQALQFLKGAGAEVDEFSDDGEGGDAAAGAAAAAGGENEKVNSSASSSPAVKARPLMSQRTSSSSSKSKRAQTPGKRRKPRRM